MCNNLKIISASAGLDEIILGFNPENADMGNPNGACYGKAWFVSAVTPSGRRFVHNLEFEDVIGGEERANHLAARVLLKGEIDLNYWNETFEVYGSDAWCEADAERAAAWQMDPNTRGTVRDF